MCFECISGENTHTYTQKKHHHARLILAVSAFHIHVCVPPCHYGIKASLSTQRKPLITLCPMCLLACVFCISPIQSFVFPFPFFFFFIQTSTPILSLIASKMLWNNNAQIYDKYSDCILTLLYTRVHQEQHSKQAAATGIATNRRQRQAALARSSVLVWHEPGSCFRFTPR